MHWAAARGGDSWERRPKSTDLPIQIWVPNADRRLMPPATRRCALAVIAAAVVPAALFAPTSTAEAAPTYNEGRVVKVVDGDTVKVDLNGDGRADKDIRHIGIDTPEHDTCGYTAAKRAMKSLVRGKRVFLRSDTGSSDWRGRWNRRVLVKQSGRLVDTTTVMLAKGLGVWMPRDGETANSRQHHLAASRAALSGTAWFNANRCGAGPVAPGTLTMLPQYLSDYGADYSMDRRRNEEFIRLRNNGAVPIDMDGWTLRVGNNRRVAVPPGGPVPPGETLTIHTGFGTDSLLHRYLNSKAWMLVDANLDDGKHVGGGSFLLDQQGDVVSWSMWPCVTSCEDPTAGALKITSYLADPEGNEYKDRNLEYVRITNSGPTQIRTSDFVVELDPYVFEFPVDHTLEPGETVTIRPGEGTSERLVQYMSVGDPPLNDDSDRIVLRTYDARIVDCVAWGSERCP